MHSYSHADQTSILAILIGSILVWSLTLVCRLFFSRSPWPFFEMVHFDLSFFINLFITFIEFVYDVVYYVWYLLRRFSTSRFGWGFFVVLGGLLGYSAPWEKYNPYLAPDHIRVFGPSVSRPGPDEVLLGQVMHHIFNYEKVPGIIALGLLIFILPKQGVRRDKLVRWVHRHRLFATYRECIEFVKFTSWFFIICFIFYVTVA